MTRMTLIKVTDEKDTTEMTDKRAKYNKDGQQEHK